MTINKFFNLLIKMARGSPRSLKKLIEQKKFEKRQKEVEIYLNDMREKYGIKFTRVCQGKLCCQAITSKGKQCSRSAFYPELTFDKTAKCCMFCWQHLSMYQLSKHITPERINKALMSLASMTLTPEQKDIFKTSQLLSTVV